MRTLILLTLTLSLLTVLNAQEQAEFGEVSEEELAMVSFEEDPEADIVILFDRAVIEIDSEFDMTMKRETRIKILTEKGKNYGSVSIPFYHEDKIKHLEAYSYLPNGEVFEFDDDNIAEERVKNTRYKKLDIPGVEVGSVIEYKYTLFSDYITNLEPWYFQSDSYTKFSQVSFYLPIGFAYSSLNYNWENYDITQTRQKVFRVDGNRIPLYTWTAKNIPPIRAEPFMKAKSDYYAKILFQLVSYKRPSISIIIAKSWDDIADDRSRYFDKKLDESGDHTDFIEDFVKNEKSPLDKAKKVYEYVRDNITTEFYGGWYYGDDQEDVFNAKKGNPSAKNYLLLNLLKSLELDVVPFLVSTRNHGLVYSKWPNLNQFNRAIVCLKLDKKTYFLDTNNKYCPFGYLTPDLDVDIGLKIIDDKASITKMKPLKFKNKADYKTEIIINDDGSISAESNIEYFGYLAVRERSRVNNTKDLEKHVNNKLEDYEVEAQIDTFYYENLDSLNKPVHLTIKYKLVDAAEINAELIYMTIPFISGIKNNPYVRDSRNFPVDYPHIYKSKEELVVNFPENFTITDKPKEVIKRLKKFNYSKIFFPGESSLRCRRSFEIGKKRFKTSEYVKLKNAYDKIVDSDQSMLVLEKKKSI